MKEQLPNNAFSLASRTRFQFWRDILHQCQETQAKVQAEGITAPDSTIVNIPQQPLARELYASIQGYNLNVRWFERILEARQMDMTRKLSYASYSELEDYAEMSYSSLNYLILELLGLQDDQKLNFVASHLGVCTGLVNLLRGFPWHLQQRVCHVPQDLLEKLNLTEEKLFSLSLENADDREKLFATVHDMASQAYAHLGQVRQLYNEHIAENKNGISQGDQVFLVFPLVTCEVYLDYLLKCDFDPYEASTESIYTSPLYYQYKLLKLKFLKKIWASLLALSPSISSPSLYLFLLALPLVV